MTALRHNRTIQTGLGRCRSSSTTVNARSRSSHSRFGHRWRGHNVKTDHADHRRRPADFYERDSGFASGNQQVGTGTLHERRRVRVRKRRLLQELWTCCRWINSSREGISSMPQLRPRRGHLRLRSGGFPCWVPCKSVKSAVAVVISWSGDEASRVKALIAMDNGFNARCHIAAKFRILL